MGAQLESEGVTGPHWMLDEIAPDTEALARRYRAMLTKRRSGISRRSRLRRDLVIGELEDPDRDAERAAARIPGADVVYLPGRGHVTAFLDVEQTLRAALPILAGSASPA